MSGKPQAKTPPKKPITYETKYADDYKEIFANRFMGGIRPGYMEIELITESAEWIDSIKTSPEDMKKNKQKRTIHAKLYIPLYHFVDFQNIVNKLRPLYEKQYGEIKLEPQKKKETKDLPGIS